MWNYIVSKITSQSQVVEPVTDGISTVRIVSISGSIALVLFGLGYAFYGMGQVVQPISEIIDELYDSNDSDSTEETEETEGQTFRDIKVENLDELDEILTDEILTDEILTDENSDEQFAISDSDSSDSIKA